MYVPRSQIVKPIDFLPRRAGIWTQFNGTFLFSAYALRVPFFGSVSALSFVTNWGEAGVDGNKIKSDENGNDDANDGFLATRNWVFI